MVKDRIGKFNHKLIIIRIMNCPIKNHYSQQQQQQQPRKKHHIVLKQRCKVSHDNLSPFVLQEKILGNLLLGPFIIIESSSFFFSENWMDFYSFMSRKRKFSLKN